MNVINKEIFLSLSFLKDLFLKAIFLFIISLCFIFSFTKSSFALQISEIMYDPAGSDTGNEWIEIYNDTQSSIDITSLKLFESNVNHAVSSYQAHTNQSGNILGIGEYAIISDNPANFLIGHVGFVGNLFDSSFSLTNSGEVLEMRSSSGASLFSINYVPLAEANGTGGTLNFINNNWVAYTQSPSATTTYNIPNTNSANANTNTTSNTNSNTVSTNVTSYATGYTKRSYTLGDIGMLTPKEIYTVVGAETEFFVKPIDNKKNVISTNTYWSYGDGAEGYGTSTKHRYQNAGEYIAVVESEVSNAYGIERINVKVLNPDILISEVGDSFVKIKNNSDEELNIGSFIVASDQGMYKLSRHLILKAKSEIKIDGRVLGFSKLTNVKILSAYNTIITTQLNPLIKTEEKSSITSSENMAMDYSGLKLRKIEDKKIINNKTVVKKIVTKKYIPTQKSAIKNIVSTSTEIKAEQNKKEKSTDTIKSVDSTPIKKEKNWLYWLYE